MCIVMNGGLGLVVGIALADDGFKMPWSRSADKLDASERSWGSGIGVRDSKRDLAGRMRVCDRGSAPRRMSWCSL